MSERDESRRRAAAGCFDKAVELLARRPHFRRQLEVKLGRRGFESHEIAATCDRLEELGYLDDLENAQRLAAGELNRKGYGPRRVRAELTRRGASDEVVDRVVSGTEAAGELPLGRRVAARWMARNQFDRGRLARHLERRGFTAGTVITVLEESSPGADPQGRSEPH